MSNLKLESLLKQYHPQDHFEQVYKQQMLIFLSNCDDCFERSCQLGHFTGSCWLVNSDCTKALMTHHRKLDKWFQLGGHCDGDNDVLRVAIKEAQEESGINDIVPLSTAIFDLDIHFIPARKNEAAHYHFDVRFLLKANNSELQRNERESKALKWFSAHDDNFPIAAPSTQRLVNKWHQFYSLIR